MRSLQNTGQKLPVALLLIRRREFEKLFPGSTGGSELLFPTEVDPYQWSSAISLDGPNVDPGEISHRDERPKCRFRKKVKNFGNTLPSELFMPG